MEEARLKAKAAAQQAQSSPAPRTGEKRAYSSITASQTPSNVRNAAAASPQKRDQNGFVQPPSNDYIQPAKKYARSDFIEYDFSKMTDTKGGFLSTADDPHNKAMWKGQTKEEQKPEGMTMTEWERERIRRKLRANRAGPYEPGISILNSVDGKEEEDEEAALLEAAENAEIENGTFKGKYGDGKRDVKGKCRECNSQGIHPSKSTPPTNTSQPFHPSQWRSPPPKPPTPSLSHPLATQAPPSPIPCTQPDTS